MCWYWEEATTPPQRHRAAGSVIASDARGGCEATSDAQIELHSRQRQQLIACLCECSCCSVWCVWCDGDFDGEFCSVAAQVTTRVAFPLNTKRNTLMSSIVCVSSIFLFLCFMLLQFFGKIFFGFVNTYFTLFSCHVYTYLLEVL